MLDTKSNLISEFLKDHQQFSRLLYEISKLLKQGEIEKARVRANELNVLAGPHIAYEEAELYPRLASLGVKSVTEEMLVGQHHDALDAIRILISDPELNDEQLESVVSGITGALSHAEHCGSLISLMSELDERQQTDSLAELRRLRNEGQKWTELTESDST